MNIIEKRILREVILLFLAVAVVAPRQNNDSPDDLVGNFFKIFYLTAEVPNVNHSVAELGS